MRNDTIVIASKKLGLKQDKLHPHYQIVGKAMILKFQGEDDEKQKYLGNVLRSTFRLWAVYKSSGIHGSMRLPSVRIISGIHTEVIQSEDGIRYKMDPEKVMFSKGNKSERHRLSGIARKEEIVLDMFAGIGYFSIPLSFKVKRVYAIDINPDSFHYLLMNIRLNAATNVIPMLGDSAKISKSGFADRIIMGHFDSMKYFKIAVNYLKKEGEIHLHQLLPRWDRGTIIGKFRDYDFVENVEMWKVKSYSPSLDHIAIDVKIKKA
jgi:tRNA wybutosine-synthesizing protein 2